MNRQRREDESYEDYKKDLWTKEQLTRIYLRGRTIWNNGTYIRSKHGKIGSQKTRRELNG